MAYMGVPAKEYVPLMNAYVVQALGVGLYTQAYTDVSSGVRMRHFRM